MVSAEQWLSTLACAGVPAFLCRRSGAGLVIVSRTPEFMGMIQALTGRLDEQELLSGIDAAWSIGAEDAPLVVSEAPDWRCVLRPVDDQYLAILRLSEEMQLPNDAFLTIVENLPDIVARYDDQFCYVYANPAIEHATGVTREEHIGKDHRGLGAPEELADGLFATYRRVLDNGQPVETEFDYNGPQGLRYYHAWAMPEYDHEGRLRTVLSVFHDISEFKQLQHQLELLARTDPLTSLLNRRSFLEHIDAELDLVHHGQGKLSLLMLDVDNFKFINDRFGHVAGDRALEALSRILLAETRARDFVARLGGDEFCVALIDADAAGAQVVAERICQLVVEIGREDGQPLGVSVSVGVAAADVTDACASDLLARVDELMYRAKFGARNMAASTVKTI